MKSTVRSFAKMQVCGNDFVIIDATQTPFNYRDKHFLRLLGDRRKGIGFDQLLIINPTPWKDVDFSLRIFNADGNSATQCGNGSAAVINYAYKNGLTESNVIKLKSEGGVISGEIDTESGEVTLLFEPPELRPEHIPFLTLSQKSTYTFTIPEFHNKQFEFTVLSMGNPHAVTFVDNVDDTPLEIIGRCLQSKEIFPNSVNVGLVEVCSRNEAKIRIFERGAGETLACGSGVLAAVVAGVLQDKFENKVTFQMRGGTVQTLWNGGGKPVQLVCQPQLVFEGKFST